MLLELKETGGWVKEVINAELKTATYLTIND